MNRTQKTYWPLLSLVLVAALAALAVNFAVYKAFFSWMHFFMGFLFCQFAMLKIFNPAQFAEGFKMYDLVAKRIPAYAFAYPVIELALGLAYLSFTCQILTYCLTMLVMFVGAVGVRKALKKGLDLRCACMGTILNVPLSTVTLTEDIGMGLMALSMLLMTVL